MTGGTPPAPVRLIMSTNIAGQTLLLNVFMLRTGETLPWFVHLETKKIPGPFQDRLFFKDIKLYSLNKTRE